MDSSYVETRLVYSWVEMSRAYWKHRYELLQMVRLALGETRRQSTGMIVYTFIFYNTVLNYPRY